MAPSRVATPIPAGAWVAGFEPMSADRHPSSSPVPAAMRPGDTESPEFFPAGASADATTALAGF